MQFFGQQNGENILFWGRKHWITLISRSLRQFIYSLVFIGLALAAAWLLQVSLFLATPFILAFIVSQVAYLTYKYKNTYLIITNRRVLISVQRSLLKRLLRSVKLNEIRETIYHLDGIAGTVFKYGKLSLLLRIDTSDKQHLYFLDLKNVRDIKFYLDRILHMVENGQSGNQLPRYIKKK
jgi:hypothetical protein